MNETQLFDRIRQRHPAPAWAVLRHVRNQTGYRKARVRTADAIALSLYPSNGLCMHGFEVKVSASDLRKEIFDPTKAAEFSEYCDYWWLVLSSEELMNGLQIPESWGVLCPKGKSLRVVVQAPKITPKPLDIGIVCGLIRKASEATDDLVKGMVPYADMNDLAQERAKSIAATECKIIQTELDYLRRTVKTFESQSGFNICDGWSSSKLAAAVKYVMSRRLDNVVEAAREEKKRAQSYLDHVEQFLADVEAHDPKAMEDSDLPRIF